MENQQIEHKKASRKDVIISLVAFANNEGGKVMVDTLQAPPNYLPGFT